MNYSRGAILREAADLAEQAFIHGTTPSASERDEIWDDAVRAVATLLRQSADEEQPATQPDLVTFRERIAEALYAHDHPGWRVPLRESDVEPVYRERAVAVLAGLRQMLAAAGPATGVERS